MPNNNIITPNNLFNLENQVIVDLTDFNRKYEVYSRCVATGGTTGLTNQNNKNINLAGKPCPTDVSRLSADLEKAYLKLTQPTAPLGSIVLLKNAINSMSSTGGITPQEYLNNYNTIMNTYQEVLKKRQSLDASLTELYEVGDNKSNFYQRQLMATSYTKILLTSLAGFLIYLCIDYVK